DPMSISATCASKSYSAWRSTVGVFIRTRSARTVSVPGGRHRERRRRERATGRMMGPRAEGPDDVPWVEIASWSAGDPLPWGRLTVVAVDVIRSTTTAITAVESGRRCFAAATVDDARDL